MASTLREYFGPQLVDYRFWNSSCLKSASLSPACRMQAGTEDSVLFTEVPERQEGETGGSPYTSFPVLLSSDFGELARGQGPGEPPSSSFPLPPAPPGQRNLLAPPPPSGPKSLIHSSFPSSSAARPFPLASLQHNGLAALRFHDTRPPGALQHSLSNTGSQHFHTDGTPGYPQPLSQLPKPKSGSQTQKAYLQTGARPLRGRP